MVAAPNAPISTFALSHTFTAATDEVVLVQTHGDVLMPNDALNGYAVVVVKIEVDGVEQAVQRLLLRNGVAPNGAPYAGFQPWSMTIPVAVGAGTTHTIRIVTQHAGGTAPMIWDAKLTVATLKR